MGNSASASDERKKNAQDLLSAIINNDLAACSRLVLAHPEMISAPLDHEFGHNAVHMAILMKQPQVLAHLLSYATIGRSVLVVLAQRHEFHLSCAHRMEVLSSAFLYSSHMYSNSSCHGKLESVLHERALKALNKGRGRDGATPLMLACDLGDEVIVRYVPSCVIVAQGGLLQKQCQHCAHIGTLCYARVQRDAAAAHCDRLRFAAPPRRMLLDAGATPWTRDSQYHRTCLHYAACKGHVGVIPMVVQVGSSSRRMPTLAQPSMATLLSSNCSARPASTEVQQIPCLCAHRNTTMILTGGSMRGGKGCCIHDI